MKNIFLENAIKRFKEYKSLGEKTFEQLNSAEMHFTPNDASNSIAIIVQHLHGNMLSRWTHFLTEDGEKQWRNRDEEFEVKDLTKEEIINLWDEGWKVMMDTLSSLKEDDLQKTITIRSQPILAMDAILRQLAHYSYHVGQIVYIGKWVKSKNWQTLSIPKKGSQLYNQQMRHGTN